MFSTLLLEWIHKHIKLCNSIVYLLMDFTFHLPTRSLLSLKSGLEPTIRGPWGTWVLSCLVSHSEGLIFVIKGIKGNISGDEMEYRFCWEWRGCFLRWDKVLRVWGFKVLSFNRSSHTSPPWITGSYSLLVNTLTLTANIFHSWDMKSHCNLTNLSWGLWFPATWVLWLLERSLLQATPRNLTLFMSIWSQSVFISQFIVILL